MIIEELLKLGEKVERIWREKNYSEEVFPKIAEKALEEAEIPKKFSAFEILDWAVKTTNLPEQRDLAARFGDPPVTIYNSPRFHIDVYFWLEGTTSIHQHAFCGAFQVFHGSSIHSLYDFEVEEQLNIFTELGKVQFLECELLKVNDIRKILPGRAFIHALFHLDQPSATIVIRTTKSPLHLPQFDYRKPSLAIDPFFEEPNTVRKIQTISTLMRLNRPEADNLIREALETVDFQTAYMILSMIKAHLDGNRLNQIFNRSQDRFESFIEIVRRRYGSLAYVLPAVFRHQEKIQEIVRRRSYIVDNELRFFLALLMNVEGKQRIFELIKSRFPESDPVEKVLDWTEQLANTKVLDVTLGNALGISDFGVLDLVALESLLRDFGRTEEIALLGEYGFNPEEDIERLEDRKKRLRQSIIFDPLFA